MSESPCAPNPLGHRTSPTPSGNGRRDSSETKVHTDANQLAGERTQRQGDDAAGTRDDEMSVGSVTGTDHPKGPCDSYSQGPFTYFRRCTARSTPCRPGTPNPAQLWESEPFLWIEEVASVDEPATFGGTRRMSAKGLARGVREGIELLPRPPETEGGTARRRGSTRRRTSLLGTRRGGWVTRPLGPEWTSSRSGASPVPVT